MSEIRKYERTEMFDNWQLSEIRKGIAANIDVSLYAMPGFDPRQMREIRKGLICGIDVMIYADHAIPWERMNLIRNELQVKKQSTC